MEGTECRGTGFISIPVILLLCVWSSFAGEQYRVVSSAWACSFFFWRILETILTGLADARSRSHLRVYPRFITLDTMQYLRIITMLHIVGYRDVLGPACAQLGSRVSHLKYLALSSSIWQVLVVIFPGLASKRASPVCDSVVR